MLHAWYHSINARTRRVGHDAFLPFSGKFLLRSTKLWYVQRVTAGSYIHQMWDLYLSENMPSSPFTYKACRVSGVQQKFQHMITTGNTITRLMNQCNVFVLEGHSYNSRRPFKSSVVAFINAEFQLIITIWSYAVKKKICSINN